MYEKILHTIILLSLWSYHLNAQPIVSVDFEQFSADTPFTQASWKAAGATVPWVDGFNQNRVYIDGTIAHSGHKSIRVGYPKGQFGPQNTGAHAPISFTGQQQYYMSYYVRFSDDFSWGSKSEGGKLPGLSGGARCSGCDTCTGSNGFTARLMWRAGGKAVLYLYHMEKVDPCGENYDIVINGTTLYFQKDTWYKISQRVKVNTANNHDGEVEIWINDQQAQLKTYEGTLVDYLKGIQYVSNGDKVDNLYFSTFHGGSNTDWAPTVDSFTWFDDFVVSTQKSDVVSVTTNIKELISDVSFLEIPSHVKANERYQMANTSNIAQLEWYDKTGKCVAKSLLIDTELLIPILSPDIYVLKYTFQNGCYRQKIWVE